MLHISQLPSRWTPVHSKIRTWVIGSGSNWAVACPLFDPFGLPLSLAHPLLSPILNTAYYISSVLHSDSDVLASTDIENGTVFCVLHTTCVDGFTACVHSQSTRLCQNFSLAPLVNIFLLPSKSWLVPNAVSQSWLFKTLPPPITSVLSSGRANHCDLLSCADRHTETNWILLCEKTVV